MSPLLRLWNVVRGKRLNDELEEELATHLALIEEEGRAGGLSAEEARRHARSRFGNPVSYREQALDGVMARWFENLWKDACLAVRYLRKTPAFTLAAVLSLALGIGASSAIFTLIDAVLVKQLAIRKPDELLLLGRARSSGVGSGAVGSFSVYSHDLYKHLEASRVFAELCASQSASSSRVSVRRAAGTAQAAEAKLVSGNYFDVLGVQPAVGRALTPLDDSAGAPPVAVVSFRYWQDVLGGDPSAIGSRLELNGIPVSIVGVAPAEFFGDTLQPEPPSFWIPIAADRQLDPERSVVDAPDQHWLYLLGRLSAGVSRAHAEAQLTASLRSWLAAQEGSSISEERQRGIGRSYIELTSGESGITRMSRAYSTTLRLLLGLSLAVLLIACANIANLLLARTDARRAESALRLALGASRARLLSLVFTESLILALAGGALALLIAAAGSRLLLVLTFGSADHIPIRTWPDTRVLAFTFTLACVAGGLFGLLPAFRTSTDIASSIRGSTRGVKGSSRSRRTLNPGTVLVVGEVAVSLVLLAGAGSFARSLTNLTSQPFGFTSDRVLVIDIDPGLARYDYHRLGPLYEQLTSRLSALPGVTSASLSRYSPFNGCCWSFSIDVSGYTPSANESTGTLLNRVSPRYFDTLGTRVLRGRVFDERDSLASPRVAVVNEAFAQRYFRSGDPVGGRFGIDSDDDNTPQDIEIVGLVENTKYDDPHDEVRPMAFLPLLQVAATGPAPSDDSIFVHAIQVRTVGRPGELAPQVRTTLAAIDPNLVVFDASPLSLHVDRVVNQERVIADLATFFGGVALVLACVGLYGLMAYTVQKRTGEIGVRMALGARRFTVVGMVVKDALRQGIGGVAIGIPVALAATQLVAHQLYGVDPADPTQPCRSHHRFAGRDDGRRLPARAPGIENRSHPRAAPRVIRRKHRRRGNTENTKTQ